MSALQRIRGALSGTAVRETALVVTSASISALVTYKVASKKIEAVYAAKIDAELEATKKFYAAFHEKPTPAELVEEAGLPVADVEPPVEDEPEDPRTPLDVGNAPQKIAYNRVVQQYSGNEDANTAPVIEPEVFNVFDVPATDTLSQEMVDARGPDAPYIITQEEFNENEGNAQDTLTYYAEDGVLSDSQDMPLDNVDRMVGELNLQRFGIGSGDKRVVYVRNEAIDQDWEIVLHEGSYAKIVAGFGDEPEETPRRRRSTQDE